MLDQIISPQQSAFIPNRLITVNAMIAFEIFHFMKKKKLGKKGFAALKLDMSKAYDRVEWNFLRAMCCKLGFADSWTDLIMRCVSTVSYSILVNGQPSETFLPQRGLRQGDPLSPYLFLICAEAFSSLIHKAENHAEITGIKVARHAPPISHLFFADDSILFFRAKQCEVDKVKGIIALYEGASGQRVNLDKSELFSSGNISDERRQDLGSQLGAQTVEQYSKYLGLPTLVGRSKTQVFRSIIEMVLSRLKGWKEKLLTKAGREILLKTVAQVIPNYAMSCFLFPRGLCSEMEKAIAQFYWSASGDDKKIHWASWEKLTRSKENGGMGFREIFYFNLAMVSKQYWRILHNSQSMVAQVLKAKYYPRGELSTANIGYQPSYLWRSLLKSRVLIERGTAWRIGNGERVNCWEDKWIKKATFEKPQYDHHRFTEIEKVADLIDHDTCSWKEATIRACFQGEDAEAILATPLSERRPHDRMIWNNTKSGKFTVKSAYYLVVKAFSVKGNKIPSPSTVNKSWKKVWHINIPPSTRHFLWRACLEALPTKAGLRKRGVNVDPTCAICGEGYESVTHIMFECPTAIQTWGLTPIRIDFQAAWSLKFRSFCWNMIESLPDEGATLFVAVLWNIWIARNKFYFEEITPEPKLIVSRALRLSMESAQQSRDKRTQGSKKKANAAWSKPPLDRLKLNSDAAVFRDGTVGYDFVVRNENGGVILAGAKRERVAGASELAEAMALRFGLGISLQSGLSNLLVETDSEIVVRAIMRDNDVDPYTMLIIEDIKKLMDRSQTTKVTWLHRNANQVAHAIAHIGDVEGFEKIWIEDFPHCCNNLVVKDVGRQPNLSYE